MAFGRKTQLTYVDDSTAVPISAENKNENERVIKLVDEELSRSKEYRFNDRKKLYYARNIKNIETFEDESEWSKSGTCTISDSTACIVNKSCVKLVQDSTANDYFIFYKNISALDLTTFNDGDSSSSDDLIVFSIYVSDYSKFDRIGFALGTDTSNTYYISYIPNTSWTRSGWYTLAVRKSDFNNAGTPPAWSNITYIKCYARTIAGGNTEYFKFHYAQLVRDNPDNPGYANPFQIFDGDSSWINEFEPVIETWNLVYDNEIRDLVLVKFDQWNYNYNQSALLIKEDLISFVYKAVVYPKNNDTGIMSVTWLVNTENYIEFYIYLNEVQIRRREAGYTTYVTLPLDNALVTNRPVDVRIEKYGQQIKYTICQGGELEKVIETVTTIANNSEGDLYFGHYSSYEFCVLQDFVISNKPNCNFNFVDDKPLIIKNETIDSLTTTGYVTSSDLWVSLKPNQFVEFELNLSYNNGSTTGDLVVAVTVDGDVEAMEDSFFFQGIPTSVTDSDNATFRNRTDGIIGSGTSFGANTDPTWLQIKSLFKSGVNGGHIYVRYRQAVADNTTYIRKESYIKVTPVRVAGN